MKPNTTLELIASLQQAKTQSQINADLKHLEKSLNRLKVIAAFNSSASKKELNAYLTQLSGQLAMLKLKAGIDKKHLNNEINHTLNDLSFQEIDALNIDEKKATLKIKKVIADIKTYAEKVPVFINILSRKEKLTGDLDSFLNKHTKIKQSAVLLEEADHIRNLMESINDKKSLEEATDAFRLYQAEVTATGFHTKNTTDRIRDLFSHVQKIGSALGLTSLAVNQFVKSLKTLHSNDTILTEITRTLQLTKQQLSQLEEDAFQIAGKYGQLSSTYLLAVQQMAKSGYAAASRELGEWLLLAQSTGDLSAEQALRYLSAADAAYHYGESVDKLSAALDGANYIGRQNAVSLSEITEAICVSASAASRAGVSMKELTAAEAAMLAATGRSGSEIGSAFQSILSQLQQLRGEFDGEEINTEQLQKAETRLHSLGIELQSIKDGVSVLRNPMEVLRDLAEAYHALPDNSPEKQGLLSDLGGKDHAGSLDALLSRWSLYEKMLKEFSQGIGSSAKEAENTILSWEGRVHSLQNSWDSLVYSLIHKESFLDGISFFDKLIQGAETFMDTVGELPVILTAINTSMVAMKPDYGITSLKNKETGKWELQGNAFGIDFTALSEQRKHFSEAKDAISIWNDKLEAGKTNIDKFAESIVQNNAQLKSYLSSCSKDAPASLEGYKKSLKSAGVSTEALRLKTLLLNSALSFGLGLALQFVIKAADSVRHTAEKAQENVDALSSRCESLRSQLQSLHAKDDLTETEKKRLHFLESQLTLQEQLLEIENRRLAKARYHYSFSLGSSDFSDTGSYYDLSYQDTGLINSLFNPNAKNLLTNNYSYKEKMADYYWKQFQNADNDADRETAKKYYDSLFEDMSDYYAAALHKASEYKLAIHQIQSDMEAGILVEGSSDYREASAYLEEFQDSYTQMLNLIGSYESRTGNGTTILDTMESEIKNFDTLKEELSEQAAKGLLTEEYLKTNQYDAILEYLRNGSVSLAQFCDFLLEEKTQMEALAGELNSDAPFSAEEYKEQINQLHTSVSTLRSALDSLYTGNLSQSDVISLLQQFPELTPYIDLSADGFGRLSEGLNEACPAARFSPDPAAVPETDAPHRGRARAGESTHRFPAAPQLLRKHRRRRLCLYTGLHLERYGKRHRRRHLPV